VRHQAWADFIRENRKAKSLTRRQFAELTNLDPSYVTLIERDGYVPRKEKVLQLAEALGVNTDHCLLMAGYAPERIPVRELLNRLQAFDDTQLIAELKRLYQQMASLSVERQNQMAVLLKAALELLPETSETPKKVARPRSTSKSKELS